MSTKKKEWRGGARKNAGRPKLGKAKMVKLFVSLPRADVVTLGQFADDSGITKKKKLQEAIRVLINTGLTEYSLKKS